MFNLLLFHFHPLRMTTSLKYNVMIILLVPIRAENILQTSVSSPTFVCNFTQDCNNYKELQDIQSVDVAYICNFGECIQSGPLWTEIEKFDRNCQSYQDCGCSSQKEDCFCHEGRCSRFHWECHQSQECNKLDKCNHGLCACIGNTCEFDCRDTADCINYPCSKHQGYHCKCDESQCIFEKDSSNVSEVVNQTKCREHKDCFGLEQEILLKDPLKLAANYMCHEGKCHGVPHFVHTNDVCSRKKDCKYFYKCFLQSLRQNSTNSCFCDSGLCQVNLKLQGEKVQQKQRKKSCRSHTETKKKNQTSDQKSNQEINHHKEKHHKENHSFKTKKTRKCVRKTKMKRSKRV